MFELLGIACFDYFPLINIAICGDPNALSISWVTIIELPWNLGQDL